MARGRMIVNEITKDKRVNELSSDTSRLAFTWLITFADVEGRTYGDPALVRSMIFPRRDDITVKQMEEIIQEWHDVGVVIWYGAQGDKWIYFPSFPKHQQLRRDKEAPSHIPPPPEVQPPQEQSPVDTPPEGRNEDGESAELDALNRINKNLINPSSPNGDGRANSRPKPEKKGDLVDGALHYANRGEVDLSDFPEDVREVIRTYCELYSQYPPRKSKKGEFALWIADARDLLNAGGAMTIQTMRDLKDKPYKWMGEAMIGRPGALVKAVRARAGEVTNKSPADMTDVEYVEYLKAKGKQ
jgi:hypothetical protein